MKGMKGDGLWFLIGTAIFFGLPPCCGWMVEDDCREEREGAGVVRSKSGIIHIAEKE